MTRENRREPRVPLQLDVFLQTAAGEEEFRTKDISYRGVFIVSQDPYPLRKLVRFRTELSNNTTFQMMGIVAHRVNAMDAAESGRDGGMGVQLYSIGQLAKEQWRQFVLDAYEADPKAKAELERQSMPHVKIHLKNEAMKEQFMTRDFPTGGIFYRTPDVFAAGTRVICDIVHPESGRTFELFALVADVVDGSKRNRGMQLAFDELSEATEDRFQRFDDGEISESSLADLK